MQQTSFITNGFDAINRLIKQLDGLGAKGCSCLVFGIGQHTVTGYHPRASGSFGAVDGEPRAPCARTTAPGSRPRLTPARDGSNVPTVTHTRGRDLSGSAAGAGGISRWLARSRDAARSLMLGRLLEAPDAAHSGRFFAA